MNTFEVASSRSISPLPSPRGGDLGLVGLEFGEGGVGFQTFQEPQKTEKEKIIDIFLKLQRDLKQAGLQLGEIEVSKAGIVEYRLKFKGN